MRATGKRYGMSEAKLRQVWDRDGSDCLYCGYPGDAIDHVEPYSYRHNNSLDNLVVACTACNLIAGGNFFSNFEEKREWVLIRRRPQILADYARFARDQQHDLDEQA